MMRSTIKHKFEVNRVFRWGWTECEECGREYKFERMWLHYLHDQYWNPIYFCQGCAHNKAHVNWMIDIIHWRHKMAVYNSRPPEGR